MRVATGEPLGTCCVRHEQMFVHPRQGADARPQNSFHASLTWWVSEFIGITHRSTDDLKADIFQKVHPRMGDKSQKPHY